MSYNVIYLVCFILLLLQQLLALFKFMLFFCYLNSFALKFISTATFQALRKKKQRNIENKSVAAA